MFYVIAALAFILDLGSKYIVKQNLDKKIEIFSDLFYLDYVINNGIAFSLPIHGLLLKVITVILIGIILYYFFFHEEKTSSYNKLGYGLLVGGACGNAYERIFHGGVTDFIGMKFFAIFNLADSFIFLGILLIIISTYAKGRTTA